MAAIDRRRADGELHLVDEDRVLDFDDVPSGDLGAGGLHRRGLPVGMQIVGRYRDDLNVLKMAHAFEQATDVGARRPPEA